MRLGLLSTANINRAILAGAAKTDRVEVVAVASRDAARADAYAAEHGLATAHGSYEALLADPEVDAVYVVHNEFRSVISQVVGTKRLLPIELGELGAAEGAGTDYLFEPGPDVILGRLLPRHVEFQLFRVLLESNAAENAARMTAMESATKNAGEMIDSLTLTYNRARQAKITKELIEIVSGAEALK